MYLVFKAASCYLSDAIISMKTQRLTHASQRTAEDGRGCNRRALAAVAELGPFDGERF